MQRTLPSQTPSQTRAKNSGLDCIIADQSIFDDEDCQKAIRQLADGHLKSLDYELLHCKGDVRFYSIRMTKSDRLLLTYAIIDGKRCAVIAEKILNHDYHKSRTLRNPPESVDAIINNFTCPCEMSLHQSNDTKIMDKETLCHHPFAYLSSQITNGRWIVFSDEQNNTHQLRSPSVVSGPPGSGKSCGALRLLFQEGTIQDGEETKNILYLVQNERLANEVKTEWERVKPISGTHYVDILTYKDLLRKLTGKTEELAFVKPNAFYAWLQANKGQLLSAWKAGNPKTENIMVNLINDTKKKHTDPHRMYQELRLLAACTQKDYASKGKNQSLYTDETQKKCLRYIYDEYNKYLYAQGKIDPALYQLNAEEIYHQIIIDEAQDFSFLQLIQIFKLARGENKDVRFFMDSHQSLFDSLSKRPFLLDQLRQYTKDPENHYAELPYTFRFSNSIARFANAVLAAKFHATGGRSDKREQVSVETSDTVAEEGKPVIWIETTDEKAKKQLQEKLADVLHCAVIVPDESFKKEVWEHYGKDIMVYTPEEYKGLQCQTIVLYRPLDTDLFYQVEGCFSEDTQPQMNVNLPKNGKGNDQYAVCFNEFFTAATRPEAELIICQPVHHRIKHLAGFIRRYGCSPSCEITMDKANDVVSPEVYQLKADELIENGNIPQAKMILLKYCHRNDEELIALFEKKLIEALNRNCPELAKKIVEQGLNRSLEKAENQQEFEQLIKKHLFVPVSQAIDPPKTVNKEEAPTAPKQEKVKATPVKVVPMLRKKQEAQQPATQTIKTDNQPEKKQPVDAHSRLVNELDHLVKKYMQEKKPVDLSQLSLLNLLTKYVNNKQYYDAIQMACELRDKRFGAECLKRILNYRKSLSIVLLATSPGYLSPLQCVKKNKHDFSIINNLMHEDLMASIAACETLSTPHGNGNHKKIFTLIRNKNYIKAVNVLNNHPELKTFPENPYLCRLRIFLYYYTQEASLETLNYYYTLAANRGYSDVVRTLLDSGVNVDAIDFKSGSTALHFAAQGGHCDMAELLLERGANVNATRPDSGITPLHYAAQEGHSGMADILLKKGANPDAPHKTNSSTPLLMALMNEHEDIAIALLASGANVKAVNDKGLSAIHLAAQFGYADIARCLLVKGADPDAVALGWIRPLITAAQHGYIDVVMCLLEKGADPNAVGIYGSTALFVAAQNGHVEVVVELLSQENIDLFAEFETTVDSLNNFIMSNIPLNSMNECPQPGKEQGKIKLTAADIARRSGYDDIEALIEKAEGDKLQYPAYQIIRDINKAFANSTLTEEQTQVLNHLKHTILNTQNKDKTFYDVYENWKIKKVAGCDYTCSDLLYQKDKKPLTMTQSQGLFDRSRTNGHQAFQWMSGILNTYGDKPLRKCFELKMII